MPNVQSWKLLVYGLVDPMTKRLRYVGKSSDGMRRPRAHWGNISLTRGKTPCDNWVRKLATVGLRPAVEVLEDLGHLEKTEENKAFANELLNNAEISWIAFVKSTGGKLLNCTFGGDGLLGRRHTPSELAALSKARRMRRSGMLGKKHSDEARQQIKMSHLRCHGRIDSAGNILPKKEEVRTGRAGIHNGFFGKKHSPETILLMKQKARKRLPGWREKISDTKSKPVKCLDDGIVFRSAREASVHYDISISSIQACARGLRKSGQTKGKAFSFENTKN